MQAAHSLSTPRSIKLPRTSTRVQSGYAHLKLLKSVRRDQYSSASFEGDIFRPGDNVPVETLGPNPVVLECVGMVGKGQYRDCLWILWRYDWRRSEWAEIARAQSRDASWSLALREPALAALAGPKPKLFDITDRSQALAQTIMSQIDGTLGSEPDDVRLLAVDAVYNQLAGRLAQLVA